MLDSYLKWLTHHKPIIYLLIIAGAMTWGWHRYMGWREHELQVNANIKQQELKDAKDAANKASNVVAANSARSQQIDTNALKIIASLQTQINTLRSELANRQKSDALLTDAELANRWATLTGLVSTDLLPNSGGGLTATHTAAVVTTQKLEALPELTAEVTARQGIIDQQAGQIAAKNDLIASLRDESGKLKVEMAKQDDACKAEIKLQVAKAKRPNRVLLAIAAVVGGIVGWKVHP